MQPAFLQDSPYYRRLGAFQLKANDNRILELFLVQDASPSRGTNLAVRRALVGARPGRLSGPLQNLVDVVSHIDSLQDDVEKKQMKIQQLVCAACRLFANMPMLYLLAAGFMLTPSPLPTLCTA